MFKKGIVLSVLKLQFIDFNGNRSIVRQFDSATALKSKLALLFKSPNDGFGIGRKDRTPFFPLVWRLINAELFKQN